MGAYRHPDLQCRPARGFHPTSLRRAPAFRHAHHLLRSAGSLPPSGPSNLTRDHVLLRSPRCGTGFADRLGRPAARPLAEEDDSGGVHRRHRHARGWRLSRDEGGPWRCHGDVTHSSAFVAVRSWPCSRRHTISAVQSASPSSSVACRRPSDSTPILATHSGAAVVELRWG